MAELRNILLVDDHPIVVVAIEALIKSRSKEFRLHCASNGAEARALAEKENPVLAIVDLSLPDVAGFTLIQELKRLRPNCKILVFSMQCEIKNGPRALRAGANGYLMKGEEISTLFEAIDVIEKGKMYSSRELSDHLIQCFGNGGFVSPVGSLSDREFEVFGLLAEGLGAREIGERLGISAKTVDSHRERMKMKLDCETMQDLSFFARDWARQSATGRMSRTAEGENERR
jgi:DNA-binding NarL/FixJ family response regulator